MMILIIFTQGSTAVNIKDAHIGRLAFDGRNLISWNNADQTFIVQGKDFNDSLPLQQDAFNSYFFLNYHNNSNIK